MTRAAAAVALACAVALAGCSGGSGEGGDGGRPGAGAGSVRSAPHTRGAVALPPVHAGFDYQIGGAYRPPAGVGVVSRDHGSRPAAGTYGICYVNAFQAQEGAQHDWDADLLLRDAHGKAVMDRDWDEALLDLRTAAKRERVARTVDGWIDTCADKGFDAVEPDNLDSWTRSDGLLDAADAQAYVRLLSAHAHARGLAVGQKNASQLARDHRRDGLDFAITEECGAYDECGVYAAAYGGHVLDVEYTASGLARACRSWGHRLSIVRRDPDVLPAGAEGYVRRTC